MTDKLEIVKSQPEDIEDMTALFNEVAYPHYARAGDDSFNFYLGEWIRAKVSGLPEELAKDPSPYWVARRDLHVVGMAGYSAARSLIHSVYVSERRGGIGTKLMEAVLAASEVAYPVDAHVVETNTEAIEFYARLGFYDTGQKGVWHLDRQSGTGMDYVNMRLDLPLSAPPED